MPIPTEKERLGTRLAGKYELRSVLGRGGMGVVFDARHEWTGRDVAVKILHPQFAAEPVVVRRFLHEARAAAALRHPNVVDVLDMGQDADGTVYLVLEKLEGAHLAATVAKRGRLPLAETLAILLPVIDALAAAHARGIVHRDLKPENVFLARDPKGNVVPKLVDFGIAKRLDGEGVTATGVGVVIGTPAYMAPEQARGVPDVGPTADVWSMGVVLYQCLSGTLPFEGGSAPAILAAVLTTRPAPLAGRVPDLPAPVLEVIERALAAKPEGRYATAADLRDALVEAARAAGISALAGETGRGIASLPSGESGNAPSSPSLAPTMSSEPDAKRRTDPEAETAAAPSAPSPGTQLSWSKPVETEARPRASRWPLLAAGAIVVAGATAAALWIGLAADRPMPEAASAPSPPAALPPAEPEPRPPPAPAAVATPAPPPALAVPDAGGVARPARARVRRPGPAPGGATEPATSTPARGTNNALILGD